jgi:hypothetical protein
MAETDLQIAAETSVTSALSVGQSVSIAGMSKSNVSASDAYDIATKERERVQRAAGRRPLFRGINMGVIGGQ